MTYQCTFCDIVGDNRDDPKFTLCRKNNHQIIDFLDDADAEAAIAAAVNTTQVISKPKKTQKQIFTKIKGFVDDLYVESVLVDGKARFLAKRLDSGDITIKQVIEIDGMKFKPLEANECGYAPYAFTSAEVTELTNLVLSKEKILEEVKEQIDRYVVAKDLDRHLILGNILLTYCQEWVSTVHYLFFVGETESGKSTALHLGKILNYRCLYGEDIPIADIYNFLGSDEEGTGTICEDEAQEILRDREKIRMYKNSYSKGSVKARILLLKNKKQQIFYKTFCPKWFAGEKIPQDKGFSERLAVVYMTEGEPESNIKRVTENEAVELNRLRNKLLIWKLQNIGTVFQKINSELKGRDQELWEDFLSVVHGTKYFQKCQNVVTYYVNQRKEVIRTSLEAKLFNILLEKLDKDFRLNFIQYWTEVTQDNPQFPGSFKNDSQRTFLPDDYPVKITHHSLAKIIDYKFQGKKIQVKFRDTNNVQHQTTWYQFNKVVLQALVKKYGIGLPLDSPFYVGEQGELDEQNGNQGIQDNQGNQLGNNDTSQEMRHVDHQKKDDEWETPPELYHSLCRKHQIQPELDTACTTSNCKCKLGYYSDKSFDGLTLDWDKPVWCNPPHSETEKWVRRAYSQWKQNNISILMIIPANSMSSNYWHDCIEGKAEISPIPGRIKFLKDGNPSEHYSRNAYVCIIWRKAKQCCTEGEGV